MEDIEYSELKRKVDNAKVELEATRKHRDQLLKQLKDNHDINSVDEAMKRAENIEVEEAELEKAIGKDIAILRKALDEYSAGINE